MQDTRKSVGDKSNRRYIRTNVVIDQELLENAMEYSGLSTRRAVVNEALRLYVVMSAQQEIKKLRGKVTWEGDLDAMREDRHWKEWNPEEATDVEPVAG